MQLMFAMVAFRSAKGRPFAERKATLALLALLCLNAGPAHAALDPELEKPYQLTIVLDVGKHRMLTDVFRQQVSREIRDGLQAAFGETVRVEVTDTHPKLAEVRRQGLKEVLDRWPELTGVKTHFVLLDYVDGQYEVRACQHDGMTGIASPVVRKERTSDPQFVSRLIALMIDTDFGIVGTFQPGGAGGIIRVEMKASKLMGAKFDSKVKLGDVFAVAPIFAGKDEGRRLEDALIVVARDADKGGFDARLFERFQSNRAVIAGYRCVRLHTIRGPVRLRVVQRDAAESPASNLEVIVRRQGFDGEQDSKLRGRTLTDGSFSTERIRDGGTFAGKAFVTITTSLQPKREAIVPVAIVDDKPVRIRVHLEKDDRSDLAIRKELWEKEAYNGGLAQQALFKALRELEQKPEARAEAIKLAKDGVKRSREVREQLGKERDELTQEARTASTTLDFSIGEQWVKFLEAGEGKLQTYLDDQEKIAKAENDPERKKWLGWVKDANQAEARGEFDRALALYKMALDAGLKDESLQKHHDKLKSQWAIKSPEHETARRFIFDVWPKVDLSKERAKIAEAKDHLATCKTASDILTPQKLLHAAIAHGGKLKEQKDALQVETSEEDRKTADEIAAASKELADLIKATQEYLKEAVK